MNRLLAFVWGGLFALGLAIAGVARPGTILGYLDVFGDWDPTLFIALSAGSFVYGVFYHGVTRLTQKSHPVPRRAPTKRKIDRSLVLGASLFGAGWGIAGMCPGAVLASAAHPDGRAFLFLIAMVGGMLAHGPTRAKLGARAPVSPAAETRRLQSPSSLTLRR
jgi:uncharacterized membrane protein YedE/YeeE